MIITHYKPFEQNVVLEENTVFKFEFDDYILRQEYYENGYDNKPCFGIGIYDKSTGRMIFHTGNASYAVFSDEQARKYIDEQLEAIEILKNVNIDGLFESEEEGENI